MRQLRVVGILSLVLSTLVAPSIPAIGEGVRSADASSESALGSLRGTVDLEKTRERLALVEKPGLAQVELEFERDGWQGDPRTGEAKRRIRTTETDRKGQFSFDRLDPGFYTLRVRVGEGSRLEWPAIEIKQGRQLILPTPLVIEPPISMAVRVSPAFDPWHQSWELRLMLESPGSSSASELASVTTDATGLGVLRSLPEGEARLEVYDQQGRIWHERRIAVYRDIPELFIAVEVVPVEGRVFTGDQPTEVMLSFDTTQGPGEIRMKAAENGRFSGYLPKEGRWPLEIVWSGEVPDVQRLRDVEVRRRPGKSYAELEIRIPDTRLEGRVVHRGEPVEGAGITVLRERSMTETFQSGERSVVREAIASSGEGGRFRLRGLEPGSLSVSARKGPLSSEWSTIDLSAKSWPAELVIELEEKTAIRGLVMSPSQPVAGARLIGLPALGEMSRRSSYVETSTDPSGVFELLIPANANRIDVMVASPGLGLDLFRWEKAESGWPQPIVTLAGGGGTIRFRPTEAASSADDFANSLEVRKNGAVMRWRQLFRILAPLNQLAFGDGQIALFGLAAGDWALCREDFPTECRKVRLPANGDEVLPLPASPNLKSEP